MTRKDYTKIARALVRWQKRSICPPNQIQLSALLGALSTELIQDNPRFDWKRFQEAATLNESNNNHAN